MAEGKTAHCCTVDVVEERDGWVPAQYLDLDDERKVPGAYIFVPVTILRDSGRQVSLIYLQYIISVPDRSIGVRCCTGLKKFRTVQLQHFAYAPTWAVGDLGRELLGTTDLPTVHLQRSSRPAVKPQTNDRVPYATTAAMYQVVFIFHQSDPTKLAA